MFAPNQTITRQKMTAIILRAIEVAGESVNVGHRQQALLSEYKDHAAISDWARSSVAQSIEADIINGMTPNTIGPKQSSTRAQAAFMIKRLLQYVSFINE